jgi:hypothetical protein
MGWATVGNVTTTHLNSALDDPSQARSEIYLALLELQNVINGRATTNGVAPLNGSGLIDNTYLPNTIASSAATDLLISPATDRTVFENIINLTPRTVNQLALLTANAGDIAYCSNGNAGNPCIAVCNGTTDSNGTEWFRIALGSQISAT